MANVQQYVEQILAARYGEEVRGSIANSILAMNDEAVEAHDVAIDSKDSSQRNAQAAQLSADNAKTSEDNAKVSELNSKASEQIVLDAQAKAKQSEDNAKTSELNSKSSEQIALDAQAKAKISEENSKASELNSNDSMRSALQSATSASASASAASASQTASANSASAAKTSEDNARQYAEQASAVANIDVATVSRNGISRPDGSSIAINQFGVLSAVGLTDHINTELDDPNGVHGTRIYTIPETGKQILQKWDDAASDWIDVAGALDPATKDTIGGVIIGDGIAVDENGKISVQEIETATKDKKGIVKIGDGIDVDDGTISANFGNDLEYDEDNSLLSLKNGDKVLASVEIAGGSSPAIITVSTDEESWKGNDSVAVVVSNGAQTFNGHFDSVGKFQQKVKMVGTYTVTVTDGSESYEGKVEVTALGGAYSVSISKFVVLNGKTATPINDVATWIHCYEGGKDYNYTTMAQVLADSTLLSNILASDNANDYLVRSTNFTSSICANSSAMTYIGNIDACADKLLGDSTWNTAICNSAYFEKVLTTKIPTMTSTTDPYGQIFATSDFNADNNRVNPFNGKDDGAWTSAYAGECHVGYKFPNKIKPKVARIQFISGVMTSTTAVIEASDDINSSSWTKIKEFSTTSTDKIKYVLDDDTPHSTYRLRITNQTRAYGIEWGLLLELQIFGRDE